MNRNHLKKLQHIAEKTAVEAGSLLRGQFGRKNAVTLKTAHDIKLLMDVKSQELIFRRLRSATTDADFLGEEGNQENPDAEFRWIVDPLDGTLNYSCGIPHFCVSIACQRKKSNHQPLEYETILGVVYDPMRRELFSATSKTRAMLNGAPCRISTRNELGDAIFSIGYSSGKASVRTGIRLYQYYSMRIKKIRKMGAAALDLCYVAAGRFDAYLERGVKIWDIAAGGVTRFTALKEYPSFEVVATTRAMKPHIRKF